MIEYILFIIGIALLLKGADYLVEGSSSLAKKLGIPALVIGLTVVAFGTSMPEFVVNVIASLAKNGDIAFGNIVGSNIFNIFYVLGVSAVITPIKLPAFAVIDLIILLATTSLLFLFMFVGRKQELKRWQGIAFIVLYVGYTYYLLVRG